MVSLVPVGLDGRGAAGTGHVEEFQRAVVASGAFDSAQAECITTSLAAALPPARFDAIMGFGMVRPPSGGPAGGDEEVLAIGRAVIDCAGGPSG